MKNFCATVAINVCRRQTIILPLEEKICHRGAETQKRYLYLIRVNL